MFWKLPGNWILSVLPYVWPNGCKSPFIQQQASYLHKGNHRKIAISLPYLSYPSWQALNVLPKGMGEQHLKQCVRFMEENRVNFEKSKFYGFNDIEINNMKRLIPLSNKSVSLETERINKINFYKFFNEHDCRRQTDFLKTFPEMKTFWKECEKLSKNHHESKLKVLNSS